MTQSVNFGQLVDPQQEEIQRQRAYAQALRQQANEPIQQQVVSGRVVPISWTQGLANMLKAYTGRKLDEEADQKQRMYMDTKRAQAASDAQGFIAALRGTPGQTFQTGANEMGDEAATQTIPAQAPDMNKALAIALRSENPMIQGMGGSVMTSMLPKTPKWEKVEKPVGDGTKEVGFVDVNSTDPWSTFRKGGTEPVKLESVNLGGSTTWVNPFKPDTSGNAPKMDHTPKMAEDLLVPDGQGGWKPNYQLVGVKQAISKAGAPNMTAITNVQNFEPFADSIQKNMGQTLVKNFESLQSAPQQLQALDKAKQLAANTKIIGAGADTKLEVAKFFNNNFGMRIAPEDVKNTETLRSTLFANVMENLKKMDSQPSEAQQKMLQDAMGRITTDPNALPQVLDFWRGQLVSKVQEHNRRVKEAQEGPAKLRFPYSISVPMPEDQPPPGGGFKILGVR